MSGGAGSEEDQEEDGEDEKQKIVVKVGMVGDAQIGERAMPSPRPACARQRMLRCAACALAGKTSLMVKYVEGSFDEVCLMARQHVVRPLAQH
jgi:hypothetical protein